MSTLTFMRTIELRITLKLVRDMITTPAVKTFGFLMFSGGIKRDQWHEMD